MSICPRQQLMIVRFRNFSLHAARSTLKNSSCALAGLAYQFQAPYLFCNVEPSSSSYPVQIYTLLASSSSYLVQIYTFLFFVKWLMSSLERLICLMLIPNDLSPPSLAPSNFVLKPSCALTWRMTNHQVWPPPTSY